MSDKRLNSGRQAFTIKHKKGSICRRDLLSKSASLSHRPNLFMRPENQNIRKAEICDGNGFSHVRATIMKPSLTIPLIKGKIEVGAWQQIVFMDFDNRGREREVIVQVIGSSLSFLGSLSLG